MTKHKCLKVLCTYTIVKVKRMKKIIVCIIQVMSHMHGAYIFWKSECCSFGQQQQNRGNSSDNFRLCLLR